MSLKILCHNESGLDIEMLDLKIREFTFLTT